MWNPRTANPRTLAAASPLALCLLVGACAEPLGPGPLALAAPAAACHQMACDQVAQTCVEVPVPDGAACDDGDACTSNDHCVAGTCVTTPVVCDDANGCTADTCAPSSGCVFTPTTAACDDGDACTRDDVCADGACAGEAVACDDGDACTEDRCDPAVGCVAPPREGLAAFCDGLGAPCPPGFVCHAGQWCERCEGDELFVPAGRFWMGCNSAVDTACAVDESPQHRVVVEAFSVQRTEVTAAAYRGCVEAGGCEAPAEPAGPYGTYDLPAKADHPITPVSWFQARDYCAWLDPAGGRPWRLCSEAEWEKAARGACAVHCDRADDDTCCQAAMPIWPWGDEAATCALAIMDDGGNGCGTGVTWPVASRPEATSAYGVLDLAGNVWEWVEDCWHPSYDGAPSDGSAWAQPVCASGSRVVRGGSFGLDSADLRASERYFSAPGVAYDYYGFRCCRSMH